jgi:FxLD family lantipeptide
MCEEVPMSDRFLMDTADPVCDTGGFDLDVTLVEVADIAGQVASTDDGCGSTCGACVTNA